MAEKVKKDLVGSIRNDIAAGIGIISDSISAGAQASVSKGILLIKYLVMTFVVAFAYAMLLGIPYMGDTIFIPLALLILMFHYEFLGMPANDRMRLAKNTLLSAIILAVVFYLFMFSSGGKSAAAVADDGAAPGQQEQAGQGEAAQPSVAAILASSISIFLFVLFVFMPIYMVKAGAGFMQAARSSFKFISKNSMKTMSYVLLLLLSFSTLSSLPALVGLTPLSALLFMLLGYAFFVFTYSFWERCRPA
ncbi:MAG: hypothetical protein QXU54_00210 [Candidatus Micrarchaeia archaeon]